MKVNSFLSAQKTNMLTNSANELKKTANHFQVSKCQQLSHVSLSLTNTTKPSDSQFVLASHSLQAPIFDCDGVIVESEHLLRQAYNDAFYHFNVRCPHSSQPLIWDPDFYDVLQNRIGGGKPKIKWVLQGTWIVPSSTIFETPPEGDEERAKLIDALQDWKMERYKEIIKSGTVEPRPGVLRLMDEAKAAGKKLAVCSAATKSSVALCLEKLIGMERFQGIDCFLASDDVKEKKPYPLIYVTTAKRLGVPEKDCLVVEDSVLGGRRSTSSEFGLIIGENCNLSSTFHQKLLELLKQPIEVSNYSI